MDCKECQGAIGEYFERQLPNKKRKLVSQHLKMCSTCQKEYQEFEIMLNDFRDMKLEKCPPEVVDSVFQILDIADSLDQKSTIREALSEFFFGHARQLRFAAAMIFVCFFVLFVYVKVSRQPQLSQQYSAEEVEQAKDQVELALAYFNQVTTRTGEILEKQVLPQQVYKPMKTSIKTALKPLINGG